MGQKTIAELTAAFSDGNTVSGSNYADIIDSNYNITEPGQIVASGSFHVSGTLSAAKLLVSESIILSSGSTIFGNDTSDTHQFTGSLLVTGSLVDFTSVGTVSGVNPFPVTASAISEMSRSVAGGDTNSTVLKLIGSSSISGSGLFEVQGSSTTLFSVTDDMTDELFAANDASWLSIISAFADRTVKLGKPGGFGIVISGSNPMPEDKDAVISITGSTYFSGSTVSFADVATVSGLPASDPFPYTGSALFTGSIGISGSIVPSVSGSYDLGSATHPWRDLWLISSSIRFMNATGIELASISVTEEGALETTPSGSSTPVAIPTDDVVNSLNWFLT